MKKTILGMALVAIILPSLAFASWWNPFSWFTNSKQETNFSLQVKCSEQSKIFFDQESYDKSIFSYENHYSSKLNKCFILVIGNFYTYPNDSLSMDLYDSVEYKHYATYIGHDICDPSILENSNDFKKCQLDYGSVWFDGNDKKSSADYHIEAGDNNIGSQNTRKEFINHIEVFMNN